MNLSCFKLYRFYSISFNLSNVVDFYQELNSEGLYLSSQKEKGSRLVITFSIKREIRKFHAVTPCNRTHILNAKSEPYNHIMEQDLFVETIKPTLNSF